LNSQSHNRAHRAIQKLNQLKHKQGKQIDILCNDMVGAHKEFIKELRTLTYAVEFYETSLKCTDLPALVNNAADYVKTHVVDSDVTFFLLDPAGFEVHKPGSDDAESFGDDSIEACFTLPIVQQLCRSNKICTLNDMLEIGLVGSPAAFSNISAVALPLGRIGCFVGFVLITRSAETPITPDELEDVVSIAPGLANAIKAMPQTVTK
jgi:hypothetical protein